MSSTFFGLTIAASGLNTAQAQINTTANNISNVETDGYSKQVVNTVASSALRCYQSFGTTGTGVEAVSVTQCRDLYYDEKYWNNETSLGYYEKKLYYMNQIESYYSETTSSTGFSTLYSKMFNAMSTLQTSSGDDTVRKQFISTAKELTEYFNTNATKLEELQSSVNDEIKTAVDDINAISEKIAILNKQINVIEQGGGTANELRDRRALLIDELSEYANTEVKEVDVKNTNYPDMDTGATYYTVTFGGQVLVDNYNYNTLKCVAREADEKYNQSDIDGLYDIVWAKDGDVFNVTAKSNSGSLKAMFEIRDGNNAENLNGKVSEATPSTITITKTNITDFNELNLPSSGTLWVNSKAYKYDSFDVELEENKDGESVITSITLHLDSENTLTSDEINGVKSKTLEIGSTVDYMGIPYYQNQMNLFLRNFCEQFNMIEESGVTAEGEAMTAFFVANDKIVDDGDDNEGEITMTALSLDDDGKTLLKDSETGMVTKKKTAKVLSGDNSYYRLMASNVGIAYNSDKDADIFAVTTEENYNSGQDAADLVVKLQTLQSDVEIFRGGGGDSFLQCIYADVTVDTQECDIFTDNFTNIEKSIDQQRQSVSGVDEDEEALDLVKFQNAYNLASKCISVFSEIYDRLILETGV